MKICETILHDQLLPGLGARSDTIRIEATIFSLSGEPYRISLFHDIAAKSAPGRVLFLYAAFAAPERGIIVKFLGTDYVGGETG